jgi:hypothetical protein
MTIPAILPRFIRLRDAPAYLGMDRHRFNSEVRPHLTEIPIGEQGIGFDRLDLDAWADDYKARNGRTAKEGGDICRKDRNKNGRRGLLRSVGSGTLISGSVDAEFVKALEQATSRKRKDTSPVS